MTREEFIQILDEKGYSYEIKGDKLVITRNLNVMLGSLKTLPTGMVFNNGGDVLLYSLETLPPGVEFNNGEDVYLNVLKTIPPGVEFNNGGYVFLDSLKTIPPGVEFNNGGDVYLDSLIGYYFHEWKDNVEGISPNTLLNGMIKRGVFL